MGAPLGFHPLARRVVPPLPRGRSGNEESVHSLRCCTDLVCSMPHPPLGRSGRSMSPSRAVNSVGRRELPSPRSTQRTPSTLAPLRLPRALLGCVSVALPFPGAP